MPTKSNKRSIKWQKQKIVHQICQAQQAIHQEKEEETALQKAVKNNFPLSYLHFSFSILNFNCSPLSKPGRFFAIDPITN